MNIIDSDNYKASGIETFFFPGGEPHARIPKDFGDALLYLKARTWNDVGIAICVMDALFQQNSSPNVILFCPYFPGARQDRTDGQTPTTAVWMWDVLTMFARKIYTFDAHSNVIIKLITKNYMPSDLPVILPGFTVIAPDHGAVDRAKDFERSHGWGRDVILCDKKRNFATGKFEGFTMPPLPHAGNYLIVDDICDGGGTFNLLAEEFEKDPFAKDSELWLWVSHGIFSRGETNIHSAIKKIYTTDSFHRDLVASEIISPRTKTFSLQPIINKILEENKDV